MYFGRRAAFILKRAGLNSPALLEAIVQTADRARAVAVGYGQARFDLVFLGKEDSHVAASLNCSERPKPKTELGGVAYLVPYEIVTLATGQWRPHRLLDLRDQPELSEWHNA